MGLFKDDPPAPPNPIATAAAQTGTNVGTSVANAFLNNTNQVTPQGSLTYDQTGTYTWNDPTTGATYNIPRFTATQTLSPQQQAISNLNVQSDTNLAQLAATQSGKLNNLLGTPFDPSGAPGFGQVNTLLDNQEAIGRYGDVGTQQRVLPQQFSLGDYGQQQTTFGDAGNITRDYGPADNFSADRARVEEALYARMDPQLQRDRAAMEARLADQGIRPGSAAHQAAMDQFNRQLTDTRLGITQTAGQEQQRMMDMAAQRAGFQNAAQQQAYQQALGRGTFANQAQAQQFQEQLQAGTFANQAQLQAGNFANQAQQQDYQQEALRAQFYNQHLQQRMQRDQQIIDAMNKERQQYLSEQYALRNQPINEITSLMSGSQVTNPNFVNTPTSNIATTDIAGLINNRFSQDMQNYQQQSANFNSLMGGIFGALGGIARGGVLSDRREKEDIDRMGTVFGVDDEGEKKKLPIYQYSYKDDPAGARHVGPMAQDVEKIDKRAVRTRDGKKYIDTTRLGSILKVA